MTCRRQLQAARCSWALCLSLLFAADTVHAEPPKRPLPDYDGRPDTTSAGDVVLWVPRVVLSPLYVVSEFVVRRPLGFLVSEAERSQWPSAIYDFFTFGANHQAAVLPTAFIDFGFEPSVGVLFFWNDIAPHNDLSLRFSLWGIHWLAGAVNYNVRLEGDGVVALHFLGRRRPDFSFFGLGPRSAESRRSRYGSSMLEGGIDAGLAGQRLFHIQLGLGLRKVSFHGGNFDDDPDLRQAVDAGLYPTPPGYETGYTLFYSRLSLSIDSRKDSPLHNTGVRFEFNAEPQFELNDQQFEGGDTNSASYIRYGALLGGYYDLNDHGRVVSLALGALFADPLSSQPIPFTELVSLGGTGLMRGFVPGRLIDRSAVVATLHYRWPIWVFLDGSLQFSVGNVFGPHLEGFKPSLLRISSCLGFESGKADNSLEFLIGIGSETFEHGTQITSLRIVVGSNHGF